MRLTVGSLPPAVYWRRRAIVLTIVLSVIFVFVYACTNDPGKRNAAQNGALSTQSPSAAGGSTDPSADASASVEATVAPTLPPTATAPPVIDPQPTGGVVPEPPATGGQVCTDQEMLVTPVPQPVNGPRGGTIQLTIKIKNIGKRTCNRDVGADFQEIKIVRGAGSLKIWSSDDCNPTRGTDLRPFTPNFERAYSITWNGKTSSKCDGKMAIGPIPGGGTYQVYGRLGSKLSPPVTMTLT